MEAKPKYVTRNIFEKIPQKKNTRSLQRGKNKAEILQLLVEHCYK